MRIMCQPLPDPDKPNLPVYDIETVPRDTNLGFDEKDPKHRCMCGLLHIVTGTIIWTLLGLVGFAVIASFLIFDRQVLYIKVNDSETFAVCQDQWLSRLRSPTNVSIGFQFQYVISTLCALLAIKKVQQSMLWPFMINSIVIFACFIYRSFIHSYFLANNLIDYYATHEQQALTKAQWGFIMTVILLLAAVISFWQATTVFYCNRYFKEMKSAREFQRTVTEFVKQLTLVNGNGDSPPPYDCNSAPTLGKEKKQKMLV